MTVAAVHAPPSIGKPAASVCNAFYITSPPVPCERAACADECVLPAIILGFEQGALQFCGMSSS